MTVFRHKGTVAIDFKRVRIYMGVIAGLYLGVQLGRGHIGADLGIVFIEVNW